MALSVMKDRQGPDWPIGMITVATPGTPVNIMSLVDANNVNAPETATGANSDEYAQRCYQIQIQAVKPAVGNNGVVSNNNNIYVVRAGVQGAGNRSDYGAMVVAIAPGSTYFLTPAPFDFNVLDPYRYRIDADTANDSALVTLFIFH